MPELTKGLGLDDNKNVHHSNSAGSNALLSILSDWGRSNSQIQHTYARDVIASLDSLKGEKMTMAPATELPFSIDQLVFHHYECKRALSTLFEEISASLSPSTPAEMTRALAGHWPHITHRSLLRELAFTSGSRAGKQWKSVLLSFAQALAMFQRSRRLLRFALRGSLHELCVELKNTRENYEDSVENTDWILIQVRSCLQQALVAHSICLRWRMTSL